MTPEVGSTPQPGQEQQLRKTKGHWGRRKRRLRRVAWVLAATAVGAIVASILVYRATSPEVRRPGEKLADITEKLARDLPEGAPEPRFTDVTIAAGLAGFVTFTGERSSQLPEDMGAGVAWGDFDGDQDEDLFLVGAGGTLTLPQQEWAASLLYENQGDGTFQQVDSFPETRIAGMAAAWGDYDGDGWLDLVVSGYRTLRLFHNQRGTLARVDALPDLDGYWAGVSWGDFDNDRDLDLYVCGYVRYKEDAGESRKVSEQYGTAVPYTLNPASFEPERNLLFQNNGDGTFDEVGELYGVSNPSGRSLTALWQDFDDDGWLDLYVANDISDNALYLNRQETFEDAGLAAWVADYRGAMGLATGDWNRDGDDDLFVTHWIAQENALYDSRLVDLRRARQTEGAAQTPVQLTFSDLAAPLGLGQIALQSVGWGTEFADFDGDGWLDLVVSNGSTLETDTVPKGLKPQKPMLLWNRQGEYFYDLAPSSPLLSTPHVSRGLALSDYDQDGDLDILIVDLYEGVRLLRNEMQSDNWLQIRLRSAGPTGELTGEGEGAKVTVFVGELELRRSVTSASYLSQSSRILHFGLGAAGEIDRIEVRWRGGETESFGPLAANAAWQISEGESEPSRLHGSANAAAVLAGAPAAAEANPESTSAAATSSERQRILAFWQKQRAAMDAFKREGDIPKATELLRQALVLNPEHEDSRYYLANCLAVQGHVEEALAELDRLKEINPLSHRAYKQWGVMRAMTARSAVDLDAAITSLERSLEINQEETGALLVLGEIALLRGESDTARQRFKWACHTNPRAVGGFFLQGYIAWKSGDLQAAVAHLQSAKTARGSEWKPEGAVAEGDVTARMHREATPLSLYWERWDGTLEPDAAFAPLADHLAADHPWI